MLFSAMGVVPLIFPVFQADGFILLLEGIEGMFEVPGTMSDPTAARCWVP